MNRTIAYPDDSGRTFKQFIHPEYLLAEHPSREFFTVMEPNGLPFLAVFHANVVDDTGTTTNSTVIRKEAAYFTAADKHPDNAWLRLIPIAYTYQPRIIP